jgi:GMP synthase-like glutamine amidotransferase
VKKTRKNIKRAHILQHVPFEGAGSIGFWLNRSGFEVTHTYFFENAVFPPMGDIDLIIVMGGPMSVNDEIALPWLQAEKKFIREMVRSGVAVLGVCLGAQLIANALGARVYSNRQKEIGWFPVEADSGVRDVFVFPREFTAFHWHGETFDLPDGAVRLAKNETCENQAFQIGRKVIGLQFHLEATRESVKALLDNCRSELGDGGRYIQTESELKRVDNATYARINNIMDDVLSYLVPTSS